MPKIAVDQYAPFALTLLNAPVGARFDLWFEDLGAWPVTRPTTATGVYLNLCGGSLSDTGPSWMATRDARDWAGAT